MAAPLGNAGSSGSTGNTNVDQTQMGTPEGVMNGSLVTTTNPNATIPAGDENNTPSKLITARNCVLSIGVLIGKSALFVVTTIVLVPVYTIGGAFTGFLEGEGELFKDLKNEWGKKAAIAGIPTAGLLYGLFVCTGRALAGFFVAISDAGSFVYKLGTEEDPVSPIRTRFENAVDRTREALNLQTSSEQPSDGGGDNVPPADNTGDNVPPAGNAGDNVPPAGNAGDNVPPADNAGDNVPPADNAGDNVPPADNAGDNVPPAGNAGDNVPPAGNAGDNVPPAGNAGDNVPLAGNAGDNVPPAGNAGDNVPPAGNAGDNVPPAGNAGDNVPPAGNAGDNVPPAGNDAPPADAGGAASTSS